MHFKAQYLKTVDFSRFFALVGKMNKLTDQCLCREAVSAKKFDANLSNIAIILVKENYFASNFAAPWFFV